MPIATTLTLIINQGARLHCCCCCSVAARTRKLSSQSNGSQKKGRYSDPIADQHSGITSAEHNGPATITSRTNEEEDALAEGEYFIPEIKSHRYLGLVQWRRRSEQQADWMPQGSTLRKGLLHGHRVLDSKLELEGQWEEFPEGETTWEAERLLRCPNLIGLNLLEQYKEKHKLVVYEDSD